MIRVNWGQSDAMEVSGRNVIGMDFVASVVHATVNTPFAANPLDLSQVKVKLRLYKAAAKNWTTIFDDVLLPLVLDTCFLDAGYQQNNQIGTFTAPVYIAAAGGVAEVLLLSGRIRLNRVINLSGDDVLAFDINVPNGAVTALVNTATSTFYYDFIEGIGMGDSIPIIQCKSLRASVSSDKFDAGDNTLAVTFINTDKAGITSANQVIADMNLTCDLCTVSDDYQELRAKRDGMFQNLVESSARNQSFKLFDTSRLNYSGMPVRANGVSISITFSSANVNASKNWYVVRSLVNNAYIAAMARAKARIHAQENENAATVVV